MTIFKSDLLSYGAIHRGGQAGVPFEVTGVVKIPSGTTLTDGDEIKFMRIGEKVSVLGYVLSTDGDLNAADTTLSAQFGYFQALDSDGNALVVDDGTGTTYTSPTSDTDAFIATADSDLDGILDAAGVVVGAPTAAAGKAFAVALDKDGYAGPVDIGLEVTATSTAASAADVYIRCTVKLLRKEATAGEWSGSLASAYSNRYNSSGSSQGLKS